MKLEPLRIPDVVLITPRVFEDERGRFSETWNRRTLHEAGIDADFVQDNHSRSVEVGTVRGLHYQLPPRAQGKLVRVVRGSILDVAVDVRKSSATFGQHVEAVLSEQNGAQLWVPPGFAHAFITLEPNSEVIYKVTDYYAPDREGGVLWNDPALGIAWGRAEAAVLSAKDAALPLLKDARLFD